MCWVKMGVCGVVWVLGGWVRVGGGEGVGSEGRGGGMGVVGRGGEELTGTFIHTPTCADVRANERALSFTHACTSILGALFFKDAWESKTCVL